MKGCSGLKHINVSFQSTGPQRNFFLAPGMQCGVAHSNTHEVQAVTTLAFAKKQLIETVKAKNGLSGIGAQNQRNIHFSKYVVRREPGLSGAPPSTPA